MKKIEIIRLIKKNMDYLDEYYEDKEKADVELLLDKFCEMKKERCDCEILYQLCSHDDLDNLGFSCISLINECILCHRAYFEDKDNSFVIDSFNSSDKYDGIKDLYLSIIKMLEKYQDTDEVNLIDLFQSIKNDIPKKLNRTIKGGVKNEEKRDS